MSRPMTHSILNMDPTQVGITTATVAAQPAIWMGYIPTMLAALASLFTIIWMGIQITMTVQEYLDRKHRREIETLNTALGNTAPAKTVTVIPQPVVVTQNNDGSVKVQ